MTPASIAPGSARSEPSATPDIAQTTMKAVLSPSPSRVAQTKAATASSMPISQLRASPLRRTMRSHNAIDSAAQAK